MLINEVSKATNLTKKAIDYYTNQGLVFPKILENGYKYFSAKYYQQLEIANEKLLLEYPEILKLQN